MRTANELPLISGHTHPNPLASHALALGAINGTGGVPSAPSEPQSPQSATPARPSTASASNQNLAGMNGHDPDTRPSRPSSLRLNRPLLMRAKSDIGPRHPDPPSEGTDEAGSVDGHFKIRHGWDDQLNSEEYNHLLTSVSLRLHRVEGSADRTQVLLHVLYR